MREASYDRIEPLIAGLADVLQSQLDRPFALFGHSMGALIAFELARELRRRQAPAPVRLLVSGHRAPQIPRFTTTRYDLPEPALVAELRRMGGTPPEILAHAEFMAFMRPLLHADFAVVETYTYHPAPPLDCPISAFGGVADEDATREQMDEWREQTRGAFALHMFAGGHFFLKDCASTVIDLVSRDLQQTHER